MKDFFISYNRADKAWAEWVARQLDDAGYKVIIQAWHFIPGSNFVLEMQQAAIDCERTIAILSDNYFQSRFTQSEWASAFAQDPTGEKGKLLPIRVEECEPPGLLSTIVYIDLVGKTEEEAKQLLLDRVKHVHAKPTHPPQFPGNVHEPKPYPKSDTDGHRNDIKDSLRRRIYKWIRSVKNRFNPTIDYAEARQSMLDKVRGIWIDGVFNDMKAPVGASFRVGIRVSKEHGSATTAYLTFAPPTPTEGEVCAAFDNADHLLLILGKPGAGKTFILLELLDGLLKRAQRDVHTRIPVVLNLSSWADRASSKEPIRDWLISELMSAYDLSRKLARYWVDNERLALLLDGLDEITAGGTEPDAAAGENDVRKLSETCRRKCLNELNKYVEWRDIWLVLCCREDEYNALGTRLYARQENAILSVVPLTDAQVEAYLKKAGPKLKSLREAMSEDYILREMARTPFLLKIMSIAYEEQPGLSAKVIVEGGKGGEEARRRHLFEKYVSVRNRKAKRGLSNQYPQWRDYLGELADKMEQGDSKLFHVDQLQPVPHWLVTSSDRWLYRALVALLLLLFVWVLVGLPAGWAIGYEEAAFKWAAEATSVGVSHPPPAPLPETLWNFSIKCMLVTTFCCGGIVAIGFAFLKTWDFGIACGLAFGVSRMIAIGMGYDKKSFNPQESILSALRNQDSWLVQGLISSALGILVLVIIMRLRNHARDKIRPFERRKWDIPKALLGVATAAAVGVIFWTLFDLTHGGAFGITLMLILALAFGYSGISYGIKTYPNQGIRRSASNMLWMALLNALIGMICFGTIYWTADQGKGQDNGIVNGILGLTVGVTSLVYGGMPLMQHLSLRLIIKIQGLAPFRFVDFLKEASELHLLRKVGGGYMFPHEYLREFFREFHRSKTK